MVLHNPREYSFSMKLFVVNEDQLLDLIYKNDVKARFSIIEEIKKYEILPALIPVKEPRMFNPVN